jgi:hypothetical protein
MFWKSLRAAFWERFGMPVPLSVCIIAFIPVLSYFDWGLGLTAVGGISGYLFLLANSPRYARFAAAKVSQEQKLVALAKVKAQVARLSPTDRGRYTDLVSRCDTIMRQQEHETLPEELQQQGTGLARLIGFYLQLLMSKNAIERMPSEDAADLKKMVGTLNKRLAATTSTDVQKSLNGQLDILRQRMEAQRGMADRLDYLESELQRIEQQVELLREQTVADTAPTVVSARIDAVTGTLSGTNEWIKRNREIVGQVDDIFSEPPPVLQILQQQ